MEIQPTAIIGRGTTEGREALAKPFKAAAAFVNQHTSFGDLIKKTRENPSAFCEGDLGAAQRVLVSERKEDIEQLDAMLHCSSLSYMSFCIHLKERPNITWSSKEKQRSLSFLLFSFAESLWSVCC